MNTLKTSKLKVDSTILMMFTVMTVVSVPMVLILVLAALFFGLPWAWVGGGLITFVALSIGTIMSATIAAVKRL